MEYEVLETKTKYSLISVDLITGRSHQIRVQMASQLNVPIFADFKYGDKTNKGNLCLWAYELTFNHPTTKQNMRFTVSPEMENSAFKFFEKTIESLTK